MKVIIILLLALVIVSCQNQAERKAALEVSKDIRVSEEHPGYWSCNGREIILLGGSDDDNLFQRDDMEQQLDILKDAGGNYIRCTMSSSDNGNVIPFLKNEDGLYDLNQFNPEYWDRFESLITMADERDIIVQVEIWATFYYYRQNWDVNPFNPKNNINYDATRSKLPLSVDSHPIFTENNFFRSVPSQMSLAIVLKYQQAFVDKLLSISLKHGNVLYCMDNETSVTSDWGKFWAKYVQKKAFGKDKTVYTTEMWDPWDLDHPFHAECIDNPGIFNFIEISQNNHQTGDLHWQNGLAHIHKVAKMGAVRPVTNVKVYGNDEGTQQTTQAGISDFIRNVLMGSSATRFHRPPSGQGLSTIAQKIIKSMRELVDSTDFLNATPSNDVLVERIPDQQYCRYIPGKEYMIYFTQRGESKIDLSSYKQSFKLYWLDILKNQWIDQGQINSKELITLQTPGEGNWIALIK